MKSAWARGARGGPPPPPARASETRGPEGRKREPRVEPGIVPGSGRVPARGPAAPHGLNRFRHARRRGLGLAEPRFPHPRSRAPATRRPAPRPARGRPRAPPAQACDEGGPLSRRRGRDSPRAAARAAARAPHAVPACSPLVPTEAGAGHARRQPGTPAPATPCPCGSPSGAPPGPPSPRGAPRKRLRGQRVRRPAPRRICRGRLASAGVALTGKSPSAFDEPTGRLRGAGGAGGSGSGDEGCLARSGRLGRAPLSCFPSQSLKAGGGGAEEARSCVSRPGSPRIMGGSLWRKSR